MLAWTLGASFVLFAALKAADNLRVDATESYGGFRIFSNV